MSISEKHKKMFNDLYDAVSKESLCLVECKDALTGEIIGALCIAIETEDGAYNVIPIGQLFNFDASKRIQLPDEDNGFLPLSSESSLN